MAKIFIDFSRCFEIARDYFLYFFCKRDSFNLAPNPDPPTPTEAYNPVPVAEEPEEPGKYF